MTKQTDIQELAVGGGQTGKSSVPAPVAKKATLPASNLSNGDKMSSVPGGSEDTDEDNNTKPTGNKSGANKTSTNTNEDLNAMFNGEELSEEFREKATTIFEAAVATRVEEVAQQLQEEAEQLIEQQVQDIIEQLMMHVDDYMSYAAEQWMAQNEVAIEHSLRTDVTEGFIEGLKQLFSENYLHIPESKVDVVESMAARVSELEAQLEEETRANVYLHAQVVESQKAQALADVVEGLTDMQADKLRALAENVQADDAQIFSQKLQTIKESYFSRPAAVRSSTVLSEEADEEHAQQEFVGNSTMAKYASAISRTLKK